MSADRPLRVLVCGNSTAVMVEPPRTGRDDGPFPERLVPALASRGVEAEVLVDGTWFGMVDGLRRRYERAIRDRTPDVVVLAYGMAECQAKVLPTAVVRHLTTWDVGAGVLARAYRRAVAPHLWRALRAWQRWAHPRVGLALSRLSPRAFRGELAHVIGMTRRETGAAVLVCDIDPGHGRLLHWLPGINDRVAAYNRLLADLVADAGEGVVLVPTSTVVDHDRPGLMPDGLHRSAEGHRLAAELLADAIVAVAR